MVIGICDDQKPARELLKGYLKDLTVDAEMILFENGKDVVQYFEKGKRLDILYMDIDFCDAYDGMAAAKRIKERQISAGNAFCTLPLIIFVTGIPERMPEAFDVRAFHFLTKPIDREQFSSVFHQAQKEIANHEQIRSEKEVMEIAVNGRVTRMEKSRIYYIECVGRKIGIHFDGQTVEYYGKMSEVAGSIGKDFFQTHRSYLVNLAYVFSYDRTQVELKDHSIIPISKYKYREFLDAYMEWGIRH